MRNYRQRNHAGALITALFITAICAMLSVAIIVAQQLLIHESILTKSVDQIYWNLQGMQKTEIAAIGNYIINGGKLQTAFPNTQIDNTTLWGTIDIEQGKFNINDLVYPQNQIAFVSMLKALAPTLSTDACQQIADNITLWLTGHANDAYYFSQNPPYRAAGVPMANISELRLVQGITDKLYQALAPNLTALAIQLPTPSREPNNNTPAPPAVQTSIDVNGASAPVLLTTDPTLTLAQAQSIIACRDQFGGFTDMNTFQTDCETPLGISNLGELTVHSPYFLVKAYAKTGNRISILSALLVTEIKKDNTLKAVIVWQSFE